MKKRKGFTSITVNNHKYLMAYGYSSQIDPALHRVTSILSRLIIYDENDHKYEFNLKTIVFPPDFQHSCWRGKHKSQSYGKREANFIITKFLQ